MASKPYRIERRVVQGVETLYCYTRGLKKNVRLPLPDAPDFAAKLRLALAESNVPDNLSGNTLGVVIQKYRADPRFTALKLKSRLDYEIYFKKLTPYHDYDMKGFTRDTLIAIRGAETGKVAADKLMLVLRMLFGHAQLLRMVSHDDIPSFRHMRTRREKKAPSSWRMWTPDHIARFFAAEDIPEPVLIGFMLLLYTGQRVTDVLKMRWDTHLQDGRIVLVQGKTDKPVSLPMHPVLRDFLAALQASGERSGWMVPVSVPGRVWRPDMTQDQADAHWIAIYKNFAERFRAVADGQGLEGMVIHGLRKSAATMLYEAGCAPEEVMAITGHDSMDVLKIYLAEAMSNRRADAAMATLEADTANRFSPANKAARDAMVRAMPGTFHGANVVPLLPLALDKAG